MLRFLVLLLFLGVAAAGAGLAWLWPRCSGAECPSVGALRNYTPPQATRVVDRNGVLLGHLAPERRVVISLGRIPSHVSGAFLAVEDKRFFQHDGVDYWRVAGSLLRNVQVWSFRQGFSTITMQLARNVFPEHLTRAKTLRRKLWEVVLAREIEREFSKGEILEMYLNQIYLGNGLYGVEAAANGYFGKSAAELDPVEGALLAAIPKAPTAYDPRRYVAAAVGRRNLVLAQMTDAGLLTPAEAEAGKARPLGLRPPQEARSAAPFAVAAVRRELHDRFGPEADNAGFVVHTSIDLNLQRAAEEALREQLAAVENGRLGNFRGPKCSSGSVADPSACLQGMFVAVEVQSGDVLALVGGRDFALSQFDRAYQARRQPGSAFKPIVYASAIAAGIPISTALVGPGSDDFEGGYNPADHVSDTLSIDLREGMRLSSNRAAVALGERVGVQEVIRTARALGIDSPIDPFPSTFLGAAAVSPVELVSGFTAFANYGIRVEPRLIVRVENSRGQVVHRAPVRRATALSAETAFLTNSIMQDVVDRGTGNPARAAGLSYSIPAAGKTGTTNDAADAWFVGVTPDVAAGVWIGYDQPRRIMVGAGGGRLAAPVWGRVMAAFYRDRPAPAAWSPPSGVHTVSIDRATGMRATEMCPGEDVHTEWFAVGTEPNQWCPLHYDPGVEGWIRDRFRDLRGIFGNPERNR